MAKKSKGFSQLLKQQRQDEAEHKGIEKLQRRLKQGHLGDQFTGIMTNPQGEVKMSKVLEAFVEPYLNSVRNRRQREKLFSIAVIAWNLAIMPEDERESIIDQAIKQSVKESDSLAEQDERLFIDELISRKQALFADIRRYIIDFQMQDLGDAFHLSVASTMPELETPEP